MCSHVVTLKNLFKSILFRVDVYSFTLLKEVIKFTKSWRSNLHVWRNRIRSKKRTHDYATWAKVTHTIATNQKIKTKTNTNLCTMQLIAVERRHWPRNKTKLCAYEWHRGQDAFLAVPMQLRRPLIVLMRSHNAVCPLTGFQVQEFISTWAGSRYRRSRGAWGFCAKFRGIFSKTELRRNAEQTTFNRANCCPRMLSWSHLG